MTHARSDNEWYFNVLGSITKCYLCFHRNPILISGGWKFATAMDLLTRQASSSVTMDCEVSSAPEVYQIPGLLDSWPLILIATLTTSLPNISALKQPERECMKTMRAIVHK